MYKIPKVSIIIPIYQASKYLEACLDSVINQTLREIEIILINDCSSDVQDEVICLSYLEKDDRITYIKLGKNLKQGGARNVGINIAKAEYLVFVDSDDTIDLHYCELLLQSALEHSSDVVIALAKIINTDKEISDHPSFDNLVQSIVGNKDKLLCHNTHLCAKLWKRTLFVENKIFMPENICYEDFAIVPRLLYVAQSFSFIRSAIYYYHHRIGSSARSVSKGQIDDIFTALNILKRFLFSLKDKELGRQKYEEAFALHIMNYMAYRVVTYSGSDVEKNKQHFLQKMQENATREEILTLQKLALSMQKKD